MSKLVSLFLFLILFILFIPSAYAQTIENIGTLNVGQSKEITISGLTADKKYYWSEQRESTVIYADCFNSSADGKIIETLGPYDVSGQFILSITESFVDRCGVPPSPQITSQSFSVTGSATQNPFNPGSSCFSQGINISSEPPVLLPNNNYLVSFNLSDASFNLLQNKKVRLHFSQVGGITYDTSAVVIRSKTFPLALEDARMKTFDLEHVAELQMNLGPVQGFQNICNQVKYTINRPLGNFACLIDDSNFSSHKVKPNSFLNFQFSGGTNSKYKLSITNSATPYAAYVKPIQFTNTTTTDDNGRGLFLDAPLNGKDSDILTLRVVKNPEGKPLCTQTITLSTQAPPPGLLPSGPPPTIPPGSTIGPDGKIISPNGQKICTPGDKTCSSAAGIPCGSKDEPGISTAIGCIHTNPVSFVKDFLRFILGIAGGLAFLMMLLGAFQMITSAGNPDALSAGRERFKDAIIGLLFVIFATLLLSVLGAGILQIKGFG